MNRCSLISAFALFVHCCMAQTQPPPAVQPLDRAIADAGQFVLQLHLDGALTEFSDATSPSASLDEDDPSLAHPVGAEICYPFTAAMHFLVVNRSETATTIVTPKPTYHVRVYKESAVAPWQLKEFWKVQNEVKWHLPIPSYEAQLQANARISKSAIGASTPAASGEAQSHKLTKIPCPRCKGEEGPMSTCLFCRKKGYIWVDAPTAAQPGQIE